MLRSPFWRSGAGEEGRVGMHRYENPFQAQCGRAYPRGHRLTAADRRGLPDAAFGLIAGPGRGRGSRKYPMPDAVHAANAKSRAAAAYESGYLSRGQHDQIMRKADAILERCGGILAPTIRMPRRRRVAANPRDIHEVFRGASEHGMQSDPDHEVGDLQDALITAFEVMGPDQKEAFFASDAVSEILRYR